MARVSRFLGIALILLGVVVLAFTAVRYYDSEQGLRGRATETVTQYRQATPGEPTRVLPLPRYTQTPTTLPEPAEPAPQQAQETQVAPTPGEAFGVISIPALGMETVILEGVEDAELDQGSGHYPSTGLPSQGRTVGVAVHRGLVADIDTQIQPGDKVRVETEQGTYTYRWEGYEVVDPEDVHVLADQGREVLVITTCHPRHSTAQRLVGTAVFVSEAERL